MTEPERPESPPIDDPPPILAWPQLYALVVLALAGCIAALAWLTEHFR